MTAQNIIRQTIRSQLIPSEIVDNRYEIQNVLAKGGMGWIYLARHLYIDRLTVIKVLDIEQPILNNEDYRTRFCYEAKVAANIEHPNIIKIYDFGFIENNAPYIAMQFLEGHNLQEELENRKIIRPLRAIKICKAILSALAVAHTKNIIHKDIKPANIFLTRPGTILEQVVVLDFGVARLQDNAQGMTRVGELAGTPEYLSPEYITQQITTPALDVYATALVFLEMLTGVTVIQGESPMQRLLAHLTGKINIPKKISESPIGPILEKALQSDYKLRYENAQLFLDAIENAEIAFVQAIKNAEILRRASSSSWPAVSAEPITSPNQSTNLRVSSSLVADPSTLSAHSYVQIPHKQNDHSLTNSESIQSTIPSTDQWGRTQTNVYKNTMKDAMDAYKKQDYATALTHLCVCQQMYPESQTIKNNIEIIQRKIKNNKNENSKH